MQSECVCFLHSYVAWVQRMQPGFSKVLYAALHPGYFLLLIKFMGRLYFRSILRMSGMHDKISFLFQLFLCGSYYINWHHQSFFILLRDVLFPGLAVCALITLICWCDLGVGFYSS